VICYVENLDFLLIVSFCWSEEPEAELNFIALFISENDF
jgi:hypothetical protein